MCYIVGLFGDSELVEFCFQVRKAMIMNILRDGANGRFFAITTLITARTESQIVSLASLN